MRYLHFGCAPAQLSEWCAKHHLHDFAYFFCQAQDLGLHRAESVSQNIELRRRLWAACVISDRWFVLSAFNLPCSTDSDSRTSLTYGHPFMIDVQDCDARLPSSGDPNDLYMDELVRLSVVLGRVLKTIYSCVSSASSLFRLIYP